MRIQNPLKIKTKYYYNVRNIMGAKSHWQIYKICANHLNCHVLRQPLPKYYLLQDIE